MTSALAVLGGPMTSVRAGAMADEREPEILVTVSDDVPDHHRDAIRAAVSVMAARSREAARRASDFNRARNLLARRVNAPLRALIQADADAAEALAQMQTPMADDPSSTLRIPDFPQVTLKPGDAGPVLRDLAGPQVFGAPWDFQWQWNDGRPPDISTQDRVTGQISLATVADGVSGRSGAHGGFGVVMTSDHVRSVVGRSLRRTTHFGLALAAPLGGTATAEGGMEMTAFDGGTLLSSAQDKRFRVRSTGELLTDDARDGAVTGASIEVDWVMLPGHVFTFNVGAWVFCEAHGSLGVDSGARARLNGLLIAMTATFTD